jgi:hypothetical protein
MDLAMTIDGWIDEEVIFAQELGARFVFARVDAGKLAATDLTRLSNRIEKGGLNLAGWYAGASVTTAALPGLIAAAGSVKQDLLLSLAPRLLPARQPLQALPALAEAAVKAGVKLALPAQALPNPDALLDLLDGLPGPYAGLDAAPERVLGWLQKAAPGSALRQLLQDRLFLVSFDHHPRPGGGSDELLAACWRLKQAGYPGLIRAGRPQHWKGDSREEHSARAFTTGYLRALMHTFQA